MGAQSLGVEASRLVSGRPSDGGGPEFLDREIEHGVPPCLAGLSAAQTKSAFRAVALHGCVEFDLVASWLICAAELAAEMGFDYPPLGRVAVNGLADDGEPLHGAERRRLATDANTTDKVIKGVIQRLIGGGRGPADAYLREQGGRFTEELADIDACLADLCAQVFTQATEEQRKALADKRDPQRSFFAHKLMERERPKVDAMERVAAGHGAPLCGILGDATVHRPGSTSALQRAQDDLAKMGITTAIKPIAGNDLVEFLRNKGIEVGQPAPLRVMPVCGIKWAEA